MNYLNIRPLSTFEIGALFLHYQPTSKENEQQESCVENIAHEVSLDHSSLVKVDRETTQDKQTKNHTEREVPITIIVLALLQSCSKICSIQSSMCVC